MEIYIVQEFSRSDYAFETDIEYHGAYTSRDNAIEKAKSVFEKLKTFYADEIDKYTYKEDLDENEDEDYYFDEAGEVYFDIDDERGFYQFTFGSEEDFELHSVEVKKCTLHK